MSSALTTPFPQPSSCQAASATYQIFTDNTFYFLAGPKLEQTSCFPPSYTPGPSTFYSPGVCPGGYTPACTGESSLGTVTETYLTCCPTLASYKCANAKVGTGNPWASTLQCISEYSTTLHVPTLQTISNGVTQTATDINMPPTGWINAFAVQVAYQASDSLYPAQTGTTSSTGAASSTATSSSAPSTGGLTQAGTIGVGVGIGVGIPLILAGALLLFWRRRKLQRQRGGPEAAGYNYDTLGGKGTPDPSPNSGAGGAFANPHSQSPVSNPGTYVASMEYKETPPPPPQQQQPQQQYMGYPPQEIPGVAIEGTRPVEPPMELPPDHQIGVIQQTPEGRIIQRSPAEVQGDELLQRLTFQR